MSLPECYISSLLAVRTKQTIFFFVRGSNNQPAAIAMAPARATSDKARATGDKARATGDKETGKHFL